MAKLADLRKTAKGMGIAPGMIRACNTAEELQAVIRGFGGGDDAPAPNAKPRKKSAVKKASAVKKSAAKKSGNSKSASKKSAPAATKSAKSGKAKRPTTQKASNTDGPSGRNMLNGVDFSETDGWNPRDGSPPDRIIKALRRFKGNRSKVFDFLVDDIWDFVGKKKADGTKRNKAEAEHMLKYRISRTAFDFAVRTEQHEPSDNRVTYGTGGTGEGIFKRKGKGNSKPAATKKASKPARKQTRKASTSKASKPAARKSTKAKAGKASKKAGKK